MRGPVRKPQCELVKGWGSPYIPLGQAHRIDFSLAVTCSSSLLTFGHGLHVLVVVLGTHLLLWATHLTTDTVY